MDSIVVVQISRGFEWEDFEEDESLEGDEDEDVFRNEEPLSCLRICDLGQDVVEKIGKGLAASNADLIEGA